MKKIIEAYYLPGSLLKKIKKAI